MFIRYSRGGRYLSQSPFHKSFYKTYVADTVARWGFTLAEVLITLGIIGIVAALTLPTLITNYEKQVTVNKLKVAYQTFSEIIEQAKSDNDGELPITDDFGLVMWAHSDLFSKKYIEPYLKGSNKHSLRKKLTITNKGGNGHFMLLAYEPNGAPICTQKGFCYWIIPYFTNSKLTNITVYVDLDGQKGKNIAGRDIFAFELVLNTQRDAVIGLSLPDKNWSRAELLKSCTDSASYSRRATGQNYYNGYDCSTLISGDGWKISDDYYW